MAQIIYTRKELRQMLNLKSAYITTYIKRCKLIPLDEDGQSFDYSEPENKEFIDQRLEKLEAEKREREAEQNINEGKPDIEEPTIEETLNEPENPEDILKIPNNLNDRRIAENWKKSLEALQLKEKTELIQLQKQKVLGNNLPLEAVEQVIGSLIKNYTEGFKQVAESIITQYSSIYKLSLDQTAKLRDKLYKEINECGKRANDAAKNDLKNLVELTKESREKGEHESPVRNNSSKN